MINRIIKKLLSREMITYLIAGVLTTVVNFAASFLLYNLLGIEENITTVAAWIIAVVFAYFINNFWVFLRGNEGTKKEAVKISKFFTARLLTLIVESASIFIFVTQLGISYWLVKIPVAVIVTVLNYVFSKLFVFIRK